MGSGAYPLAIATRPAKRRTVPSLKPNRFATGVKGRTLVVFSFVDPVRMTGMKNESDQARRAISTGKLNALLRFHTRPINVVVFHGS